MPINRVFIIIHDDPEIAVSRTPAQLIGDVTGATLELARIVKDCAIATCKATYEANRFMRAWHRLAVKQRKLRKKHR